MRRASKYCKNSNYFCKCAKCHMALEKAHELEMFKIEQDLRFQNRGKLTSQLMKELL